MPLTFASPLPPADNKRHCLVLSCRLQEGVRRPSESTVRMTLTRISRHRWSHRRLLQQDPWCRQRHPPMNLRVRRVPMMRGFLNRCHHHLIRRRRRQILAVRTLASLSLLTGLCFAHFWLPFWGRFSRCEGWVGLGLYFVGLGFVEIQYATV